MTWLRDPNNSTKAPVWRDSAGVVYYDWKDLELSHHTNVVGFLKRKAECYRIEMKRAERMDMPTSAEQLNVAWTATLLLLEEAQRTLKERTDWELDEPKVETVTRRKMERESPRTIRGELPRKLRLKW